MLVHTFYEKFKFLPTETALLACFKIGMIHAGSIIEERPNYEETENRILHFCCPPASHFRRD